MCVHFSHSPLRWPSDREAVRNDQVRDQSALCIFSPIEKRPSLGRPESLGGNAQGGRTTTSRRLWKLSVMVFQVCAKLDNLDSEVVSPADLRQSRSIAISHGFAVTGPNERR